MDDALERRLRVLLAKDEIRDVLLRYAHGADRGDEELIASCFHPDAVDDHGTVELTGLQTAPRFSRLPVVSTGGQVGQHFIGNILIDVRGDIAYSESYFIAFRTLDREDGEYTRFRAARYLDRFELRNGEWRIAYRVVVDDWDRQDRVVERAPDYERWRRGRLRSEDPSAQFRSGRIADNEQAIRRRLGVDHTPAES